MRRPSAVGIVLMLTGIVILFIVDILPVIQNGGYANLPIISTINHTTLTIGVVGNIFIVLGIFFAISNYE